MTFRSALAGVLLLAAPLALSAPSFAQQQSAPAAAAPLHRGSPLVLMTDFGTKDGAVSAVKGVAYGVSQDLLISDLSHQIDSIWDGAYRLYQVAPYWPKGTVFVTVVDPGVGTARKSIVVRTKAGHYFVGPDNGLYTLIDEAEGIDEARVIDETVNRLRGSEASNTFHGRDVFGYTGARLAAGVIGWEQVGPVYPVSQLVRLPYQRPSLELGVLKGMIPVLDVQYGNVWSNIPRNLFEAAGFKLGDKVKVEFLHDGKVVDSMVAPFTRTFGDVPVGQPMVYINSLLDVSVALNQGDYARDHHIGSGPGWSVQVSRP
ncbi:S-adenosyl-l-methionine hydroxide adenosyltransferase family protein [Novosphingobium sp. FKTRR1]|uniref:SAM hydrolase/SAM-dependent halogenase family protein n=1 Tax=Novosphingobium sp. FKTRR1 TaxID=2879118 RepID=UPI001CF05F70|nr:S-adenosyl-l-methionine hydroxide adenosyltransferase family protein [Novosphingobium sp. FKTRR1]